MPFLQPFSRLYLLAQKREESSPFKSMCTLERGYHLLLLLGAAQTAQTSPRSSGRKPSSWCGAPWLPLPSLPPGKGPARLRKQQALSHAGFLSTPVAQFSIKPLSFSCHSLSSFLSFRSFFGMLSGDGERD